VPVAVDFGLCGACWRETAFIGGLVCDLCGLPLPGDDGGTVELCDDCLTIARPWQRGRAAVLYKGKGRDMVLALKHGDRLDLARPMGDWLARALAPLIVPGMVVAPVPLHRLRLLRRRFNQSALLARRVALLHSLDLCPDLLWRTRATESQDGRGRDDRFRNLQGAIAVHPGRAGRIRGRSVLLVDDVMTSGATLAAATDACLASGAVRVCVAVMARVAKDT
jgi:predicted amidophosphoribosyltransferase